MAPLLQIPTEKLAVMAVFLFAAFAPQMRRKNERRRQYLRNGGAGRWFSSGLTWLD
jgi:hypothetical protein